MFSLTEKSTPMLLHLSLVSVSKQSLVKVVNVVNFIKDQKDMNVNHSGAGVSLETTTLEVKTRRKVGTSPVNYGFNIQYTVTYNVNVVSIFHSQEPKILLLHPR